MKTGYIKIFTYYNVLILLLSALLILNCNDIKEYTGSSKVRVGIIFDMGGKDDKGFNAMSWEGAVKAKEELDIFLRNVEPGEESTIELAVRTFAEEQFDIVIGVGFACAPYIKKIAQEFPAIRFAVVDAETEGDNVASLLFQEHQGSFLAGVIAGSRTGTGVIGFVGGMDIPIIRRFFTGYKAGAEYIRPDIKVYESYAGVTGNAWRNPTRGKELALSLYSKNADIIFAAAGATGLGVFDAAEEQAKYVIGVDANQNWIKPGRVLTSMIKRGDTAVYSVIKSVLDNKFRGGVHLYGLHNNGVGCAVDKYNKDLLNPELLKTLEKVKQDIINGKIRVPDYFELNK